MQVETLSYTVESGWSAREFPALDSDKTLVIVFGATRFLDDPGPVAELAAAYPQAALIGCSTSGEILGAAIRDDSLAVAVLRFESTTLATVVAPVESAAASRAAGEALARELLNPSLRGVFVLSDGLLVNGSELIGGLNAVLPETVIVTGGLAGDGARFQRTWVIKDGRPQPGFASAVGFYGDQVRIGHGSKGGWDIFGPERVITRSEGNVLYELDGRPALQLYKEYLGERAAELPASALLFPLAVRAGPADEKQVVRTVLAIDEAKQSMTFAGDLPQGYRGQLMKANFDRLVDGASGAALVTQERNPCSGPALVIAISCVGRRLVMGERTEEELEAVLEALPAGVQQVGFYSYGEISPYAAGHCDLHNQTMTLTTICEG